jgi:hypothetical protein
MMRMVYLKNYEPPVLSLPPNKFGGPLPFTKPWAAMVFEIYHPHLCDYV